MLKYAFASGYNWGGWVFLTLAVGPRLRQGNRLAFVFCKTATCANLLDRNGETCKKGRQGRKTKQHSNTMTTSNFALSFL